MRRGLLDAASNLPNSANFRKGVDAVHLMAELSSHGCDFRTHIAGIAWGAFCVRALATLEVFNPGVVTAVVFYLLQERMLSLRLSWTAS